MSNKSKIQINGQIYRKKQVGNRKAGSRMGGKIASHPPMLVAQSVRTIKIRCLATATTTGASFTIANFSGFLGVLANAATTGFNLSQQFRLRRISIWGPVSTAGTPVTVAIQWVNSVNDFVGPPVQFLDTSVSFDWPAHVSCKPPRGSLSDRWHDSTETDKTVVLTYPSGSTVDFSFDWVLSDLLQTNYAGTLAGATVGSVTHNIQHNLTPQGVNTN